MSDLVVLLKCFLLQNGSIGMNPACKTPLVGLWCATYWVHILLLMCFTVTIQMGLSQVISFFILKVQFKDY